MSYRCSRCNKIDLYQTKPPYYCSECGNRDLYETIEDQRKAFLEHLDRSAKTVDSWPKWKQCVLGGRILSKEEVFKKKINEMDAT